MMKMKPGFTLRQIDGLYLVGTVGGSAPAAVFSVNETGAFLWRLLAQGKDERQLLDAMLLEYDVDADTANRDIREFLDRLGSAGVWEEDHGCTGC